MSQQNNINVVDVSEDILAELKNASNEAPAETADWEFFTSNVTEEPQAEDEDFLDNYIKLNCDYGHEFYTNKSTTSAKCTTCNARDGTHIKALRTQLDKIFEKPFSRSFPPWAVNPKSGRKLLLKIYNPDLRMCFESGCTTELKWTRNSLCKKNNYLFIYMKPGETDRIYVHYEKIKAHIEGLFLDDLYIKRVLEKIKALEPAEKYGGLDHGEKEEGERTQPYLLDDEFLKELVQMGRIDYSAY